MQNSKNETFNEALMQKNAKILTHDKTDPFVTIDGEEFSESLLIGDAIEPWLNLKMREYEFRMNRVDHLIFEKYTKELATKAGLSLGEFLNKFVFFEPVELSESELTTYLAEKKITPEQIQKKEDLEKQRLHAIGHKRQQLKKAFIQKQTTNIKYNFPKPVSILKYINPDGVIPFFSPEQKNYLVAFWSFSDKKLLAALDEINEKFKDNIRIIVKLNPNPLREESILAAQAALCAFDLGGWPAFLKYTSTLSRIESFFPDTIKEFSMLFLDDPNKMSLELSKAPYIDRITQEAKLALELGAKVHHSSFLNGVRVNVFQKHEELEKHFNQIIDRTQPKNQ